MDLKASPKKGTSILFDRYESAALVDAVDEARAIYKKAADWKVILKRCMAQDFSWAETGREYMKAYRKLGRALKARKP